MRKLLLLSIIFLSSFSQLSAQFCLAPSSTLAIVPNGTIQYTPYYSSGARVFSFTGTAGCVYTFSTCGQSTNDTYLRLYNTALTFLVGNDDQCGFQSTIVWTCPANGTYYMHLSRWVSFAFTCGGLTSSTRMSYTVSCPTPCTQTSVTLNMFDSFGDGWNGAVYTLTNSAGAAVASGTLPTGSFGTAVLCLAPGCYYMNVTGGTYPWECSWNLSVAGGTVANGGAPATNIVVPVGVSSCTVPNPPTSISATAQTICLGGSTTLTANGPVGTVYWFAGGCNTTGQIGTGNSITVSPTVTTTYYARNFQNGNFSNTCVSYTVIVNNATTPTFNALPNICSGTTAPVLPSSSVNSINGTWNPANISTVVAGTTNYIFTPNAGQCAVAATVAVTVNPSPTVAITPTPAGCATVSNGALNVTATGGLAAYNVSWTGTSSGNPAGTEIAASGGSYAISNLAAGTYNVTLAGSNSCLATANATISSLPAIITTATPTAVTCNGLSNGSISVSATNGTAPYNVSWTGPSSGNPSGTEIAAAGASYSIPTLGAGVYSITVTDAVGCISTISATVTEPTPLTSTFTQVNVLCFGNSSASINLTPTGGTAPYNYLWSNNATTEDLANLASGTYSITITDANGCTSPNSVTITQPTAALSLTETHTNVLCFGNATGAIDLIPAGGTAPYTYLWSNNATTEDLNNIASGTYSVTTTDANGCTATLSVTITQPIAGLSLTETHTNVLCFGASTASIDQTVTGGTAPYTYLWSNNATTEDLTNIASGTYTVTTTDAAGCSSILNVIITQPTAALSLTETHTNVLCFGNTTGGIDLIPSGGTAPYTYLWSNNATTEDIANIASGTYTVTTTDANGCTATLSVTITQPTAALSLTETHTNVLCFGNSTGGVNLTSAGGTAPYTYLWSNNATTEDLNNIASGTYSVTTTDANGCTATLSVTITQPIAGLSLTETHTNVLCFGASTASIDQTVAGGTGPYTYLWSNNATTEDIANIASGTYAVTTTDANGCTATLSVIITQPAAALSLTETHTNVLCFGNTTGGIDLIPSGGTAPYTYLWSNNATTEDIANIASGTYTVTTTDANGCTATLSVTITQPTAALSLTETHTNVLCFGNSTGGVNLTPAGGTAPYTYLWSNNATTEDLNNIASGTYSVTTTDASGCTVTLSVTITQPQIGINLSETHTNVLCFGNATAGINQTVTGGTGPYTYLWNNTATTEDLSNLASGTYTVTTTDANGCTAILSVTITQPTAALSLTETHTNVVCFGNTTGGINLTPAGGTAPYTYLWSNNATTEDLSNVASGTYSVTTTDANGCTATLSVIITQPTAGLSLTETHTNVLCFGNTTGGINLTPAGGTAPYTYLWSNNATTEDIANLASGTYSVTTTDANGCTATLSVMITQPAAGLSLTETHTNVLCFGASTSSINQTVTGGTGPYSYLWNNNASTEDITNVPSGTYIVTTTDANGCSATLSVTITQPTTGLSLTETHTNILCFGNTTGGINLTPAGGTTPYTYLWSNNATTEDLSNIASGTYSVTTTDANGCTATLSVTITQPTAGLSLTETHTNVLCFGASTASIDQTVAGGTGPYTYLWSNNATTEDIANIASGTYSVTTTDASGCTATLSVTITQPQTGINLSETHTNVLCFGNATAGINQTVTGGTAPYTYLWSNNATTEDLTNIASGTYTVTTTDAAGCTATLSITITQPATGLSLAEIHTNVLCFGNSTGGVNLTPTGGTGPYTYLWSNNATTEDLANIASGTYTVTTTDANGCTSTLSVTITQPAAALSLTETHTNVLCFGASTASIDQTVTGGTAPYTYLWSNNGTSEDIANLASGTYSVTTTDASGCTATLSVTITQPQTGINLSETHTNVLCFGNATAGINQTVTGGTGPYTYLWSNNATTEDLANIASGTYTVTTTDANGCTATLSVTITQPSAALSMVSTIQNVVCVNGTGSVDLTVSGGTPNYTYLWSNNATTQDLLAVISGLYTVTVTDANGCTATFNSTVAQAVSSTPVQINNQTGTNILSCLTTAIVLQGTGGTNYTWNAGSTPNSATNTFIAPGTYTLSTFDSNNCPVTVSVSITQNISLPIITITSNSGGLALDCNNSSISVTANGASQYAWSGGLGNNANTTISSVGTYSVVGTGANGCIDSAAITITLAPSPSVTINDTSICNGQSLILAPTFFPAGGSIIWSNALPTPTISVSPNVTTTYSVLYTWNGCTVAEDILVTVNPTPTVTVNNPTICLGDQAQITATPNILGGTYLWSGAQTTNTISVSPVQNNTNYSVVYSLNGCVSQNATAVVTVNPIPTVNVLPVTICNGQSGNLVATPNLPGGNFLWINGGEITNSITASPTTTTTYPVIYILNGCPSLQATGTLNVNPLPIASMLADTLSGCAPLTVSFEADTTNQQATYQWSSNSGCSGNGASSMMTFTNGGCYNVTLTATMNGCVSSATNLNYICVEALPVAEFSTSISHFSESSQSMNFINSSSGASSYVWSFGDGASSVITSPTHLFANTTSGYTIMLTAMSSLGCADSTLVTIDYQESEVYYIPNSFTPDGDKYNQVFLPIFTAGIDPYNYTMEIYNRWGEVIFETHNMEYGWDGSYGLEGNDCPSGSYTYRIVIKMPDIDERKILAGHVNLIR